MAEYKLHMISKEKRERWKKVLCNVVMLRKEKCQNAFYSSKRRIPDRSLGLRPVIDESAHSDSIIVLYPARW